MRFWAAALRVMTGAGKFVATAPAAGPPLSTPGMVPGAAGVEGAVGKGDWPRSMAETAACAPPPDPPRGAIAAPPPIPLAGFHGAAIPCEASSAGFDTVAAS